MVEKGGVHRLVDRDRFGLNIAQESSCEILTLSSNPQEREAEFRDQSESTNSRVVRWMVIQLVVLGITCAWQLSHLRSFFIKQKLT